MKRRGFLTLLGVGVTAPFVAKAFIETLTGDQETAPVVTLSSGMSLAELQRDLNFRRSRTLALMKSKKIWLRT